MKIGRDFLDEQKFAGTISPSAHLDYFFFTFSFSTINRRKQKLYRLENNCSLIYHKNFLKLINLRLELRQVVYDVLPLITFSVSSFWPNYITVGITFLIIINKKIINYFNFFFVIFDNNLDNETLIKN